MKTEGLKSLRITLTMILFTFSFLPSVSDAGDFLKFSDSKKILEKIHKEHGETTTIYCGCKYSNKTIDLKSCGYVKQTKGDRAYRKEWEHVAAAQSFGQSFKEWRDGNPSLCGKSRGRKCAAKNDLFAEMEGDMHNLWPEIGELNGLRSNYPMASLSTSDYDFGGCKAKISGKKFEPQLNKGLVARTHLYMDSQYPGRGIVSDKNRKLFEAWDAQFPPSAWECKRERIVSKIQKKENLFTKRKCRG